MFPSTAALRGRIGPDERSGFYAQSYRYCLYLTSSCPRSLRIATAHGLLGLGDHVGLRMLPALPDDGEDYRELRPLFEATAHGYPGPAAPPALVDRWTGRVVSCHTPDILRDLAEHFGGDGPDLHPAHAARDIAAVAELCDRELAGAAQRAGGQGPAEERAAALARLLDALDGLAGRLAGKPYLLGDAPTLADLHLWAALVHLDIVHRWHLDADAVRRIADRTALWAYARRLLAEPAFRAPLNTSDIAARHHRDCRGLEAAGAAVQIIDWTDTDLTAPAPAR